MISFRLLDETAAITSFQPHTWHRYMTLDEINAFLDQQAQLHRKVATTLTLGYSYEGRPIKGIKISFGLVSLFKSLYRNSKKKESFDFVCF